MLSIRTAGSSLVMPLLVLTACSPAGEPEPAGKTLRFGIDLPLTGPESRAAMPALNGIRYFVRTHPTIAGFSVSLVIGQGLAGAFTARFTRRGGTVGGQLDAEPKGSFDVSGFLGRVKTDGAQVIYYGGVAEGCAVRAQMASVFSGATPAPFLGADGITHDPGCVRAAGPNAAGVLATVSVADAASRGEAAGAIRSFKGVYPGPADFGPYTMPAYDATGVLYAALERAISRAGGSLPVIAELARTSGLEGTTGRLGFDPSGDTTNRVISIFEAPGPDPRAPWKLAGAVDYSAGLPY